jgi:hypothetical protein
MVKKNLKSFKKNNNNNKQKPEERKEKGDNATNIKGGSN